MLLNYDKSKIVVFERTWKPPSWLFNSDQIQQVKMFWSLGINFHCKHQWASQHVIMIKSAKLTSQSICIFFYMCGGSFAPAALNIFKAKIVPQLLYGIQLWLPAFNIDVKRIHSSFLYSIMELPLVCHHLLGLGRSWVPCLILRLLLLFY